LIRSELREYLLNEKVVGVDLSTFPPPLRKAEVARVVVGKLGRSIVGRIRPVYAEDLDEADGGEPYRRSDGTRNLRGYLIQDRRGGSGVESAMENVLRGTRGQEVRHRDTGEREVISPERGNDVCLTIDMRLQAYIRAIRDPSVGLMRVQGWHKNEKMKLGRELNGAAVVLEVESGNVLAMVSIPSVGLHQGMDVKGIIEDEVWPTERDHAGLNRITSSLYPPGSTLKPLVYCLAAREGVIEVNQKFTCEGYLDKNNPNILRCWGWRPDEGKWLKHGEIGPVKAVAESCNIYFYSCGRVLGAKRLVSGLMDFGFGRKPGLGLGGEVSGIMPRLDGDNRPGRGLTRSNATFMGIGQGPIAATPLQVANAHAALVRGGFFRKPTIFINSDEEEVNERDEGSVNNGENNGVNNDGNRGDNSSESGDINNDEGDVDLGISQQIINNALKGMYESANNIEYGTAQRITYDNGERERILTLEGLTYRCKTGTAQANTDFDDINGNGRIDVGEKVYREGEHGWYVCHVQKPGESRACYVIVVVVEYGGSGSRVAGPIVNQLIYAMRGEEYL